MSWPDLESFVPAPLRGGPIPPDMVERVEQQFREGWRRHVARRVHGAEERALALVITGSSVAPYGFIFDGRTCEAASPVIGGVAAAMAGLPNSGMLMRQGINAVWRESLSSDKAAARWRELGGDEAFALEPLQRTPGISNGIFEAYAIVRRGQDRVRIDLAPDLMRPANAAILAWARRLEALVRPDLREPLLGR